jgi:hypothetical protein
MIGFLVGVIVTVGLMASTTREVEDLHRAEAITSGYMVHDGNAYHVTLVASPQSVARGGA